MDRFARSSPPLSSLTEGSGLGPGPGHDSGSDSDSDSSSGSYEPLTAVRVMALNRMQQNRRREGYESEGSKDSMKAVDSEGSESDRESVDSLSEAG